MTTPKLYEELAAWWPLLSAPEDYAEEAVFYREALSEACLTPPRTVLELGCGGGNNASHLKAYFAMTLVDLAPGMVAVSRALNPECAHLVGDMRSLRLGERFDAVFVHDAVCYMVTPAELRQAMATAFAHCKPGGGVLFAPDHLRENFRPSTDHGGHDGEGRGLRYLEWTWDPDPDDTSYVTDYAYLVRDGERVRVVHDRHHDGLFARADWLAWLADAGFRDARAVPFAHSEVEPGAHEIFVAQRPPG